jgi:hypothetical protein
MTFGSAMQNMSLGATTLGFNYTNGESGRSLALSSTFVPPTMMETIRLGAMGINPTAQNPALALHGIASAGILQLTAPHQLYGQPLGTSARQALIRTQLGRALGGSLAGQVSAVEGLLNIATIVKVVKAANEGGKEAAVKAVAEAIGEGLTGSAAKSATGGPKGQLPEDPKDKEKRKYNDASYHHQQSAGTKSKAPINGQQSLDNSVPYGERGNRISVDKANDEYIVLMEDSPGNYHGHVRSWDQLEPSMQSSLKNNGLVRVMGSGQKAKIL